MVFLSVFCKLISDVKLVIIVIHSKVGVLILRATVMEKLNTNLSQVHLVN